MPFMESESPSFQQEPRPPQPVGSPYVPLDSWVYSGIEKLSALGYIETAFLGLKPWTRIECARLIEQAEDVIFYDQGDIEDIAELQSRLRQEFTYELSVLNGTRQRKVIAALESVYVRNVSVMGPPLTDGYHFGQTMSYDFGRPFRSGMNAQLGGSFQVAAGPAAVFVRAEFQHAPSAPPLPDQIRNFIANSDLLPLPAPSAIPSTNRLRLLDAYMAVNLRENWQISFGKQSLSWGPGAGGSFLWSSNVEPVPMLRMTSSATSLPGFFSVFGPTRIDSFFGRLSGRPYIAEPYIYGNKINFKPLASLEIGFGRTVTIGGKGGTPLTPKNLLFSFFGQSSSQLRSVPGDSHSSFDWSFEIPKLHHYVVFYGELYADDDFLPLQNLPKNPFRPGIYVTRFPGLPKLDLHLEAASTESPGQRNPWNLNYWNAVYRDGYTSNGSLIGNTVGRMGRSIQCWWNYWFSSRNQLQFAYKHSTISSEFVPGGGAWQDYSMRHEVAFHSGLYLKSQLQFEHISHYPLLTPHAKNNLTTVVELGWTPHHSD